MENRPERSLELPEVIIQHILSFLHPKETSQTLLLSKSWLTAWSTRPFLNFDPCIKTKNKEGTSYINIEIPSHVIDGTLESYVERRISIVRFHLLVDRIQERWLKMAGETNLIQLHLLAQSDWTASMFQEIFLIQSLQVLSIVTHGYPVLLRLTDPIKCLNLKKLELLELVIDEVIFLYIMSSCPLIEDLMLSLCNLIDPPTYNPEVLYFNYQSKYKSLKRLSLEGITINDDLLQTLLSKSLQLEDFTLYGYNKLLKPINLSSVTLKRVTLGGSDAQLVSIDAPNLRKLKYEISRSRSMTIPLPITIRRPVTEGTVEVTIVYYYQEIDESWFHKLREILSKFAKSNVKFILSTADPFQFDLEVLRAAGLPPLKGVETLRFEGYDDLPLLYAFLTICRPKVVLLDRRSFKPQLLVTFLKDLNRGNLECCSLDQNKCWRHYVKDAKLYYREDNKKITLGLEWESS